MPYILLVLTILFWSGNHILGRGVHEIIPPITLAFWRWVVALLILFPFFAKKFIQQFDLIRQHWKILCFLGLLSVTNYSAFIYLALHYTTAINTVLANSLVPVFIVLISWVGFGEKISWQQAVGIAISMLGLIWIVARGDLNILLALKFSKGDVWMLAAGLSWALYSILLKNRPKELHPINFFLTLNMTGLIFLLPFYLLELRKVAIKALTINIIGIFFYLALFASILAFIFWTKAIDSIGANKAGIFVHLHPVFTIFLAYFFLGERLQGYHFPGAFLIFVGICLTTIRKRNQNKVKRDVN